MTNRTAQNQVPSPSLTPTCQSDRTFPDTNKWLSENLPIVLTYFSATTELLDQNLSALPTITIHQSTVVVDNGSIRDFPATVLSSQ